MRAEFALLFALVSSASAGLAIGCGSSGTTSTFDGGPGVDARPRADAAPDGPAFHSVTVEPANATLQVPFGGTAKQSYAAYAVIGGHKTDITPKCGFSVGDSSLGGFEGSTFDAQPLGGTTEVVATCSGIAGTANLSITLTGSIVVTGAPPSSASLFSGATSTTSTTNTPQVQYPLQGSVAPLNIPPIDVQWTTANDDLFHVALSSKYVAVDIYTTGADATVPSAEWTAVAQSARGTSLQVVVEGLVTASPTVKYTSPPVTMSLSVQTLDNTAIYYWASSLGDLMTLTFGDLTPPTAVQGDCTACHSVSRAGSRIGYSRCIAGNCAPEYVGFMHYDTTSSMWVDTVDADGMAIAGTYTTFSPVGYPFTDDTQSLALVTLSSGGFGLYDPDTGAAVPSNATTVSVEGPSSPRTPIMPDWSPDGHTIVFASTLGQTDAVDVGTSTGIATMSYTYTGGTSTFGTPTFIIPGPISLMGSSYSNLFFPSFSPDGKAIVFNATTMPWRDFTDALAPGERLMISNADGSHVTDLTQLNGMGQSGITWPHWAPAGTSDYFWLVFSSDVPYGHMVTPGTAPSACVSQGHVQCKQIWIGAIDPAKIGTGEDPSAVPVWMPGQDTMADNISPYWTVPPVSMPK
jgi:WD40 repeat protein